MKMMGACGFGPFPAPPERSRQLQFFIGRTQATAPISLLTSAKSNPDRNRKSVHNQFFLLLSSSKKAAKGKDSLRSNGERRATDNPELHKIR
jgi:hypothetical protein